MGNSMVFVGGPLHGQALFRQGTDPVQHADTSYQYIKLGEHHLYCDTEIIHDREAFDSAINQLRADGKL